MTEKIKHADRQARYRERKKLLAEAVADPIIPPPPYFDDAGELLPAGREALTMTVGKYTPDPLTADILGMTPRAFAKKIKTPGDFADAYEIAVAKRDVVIIRTQARAATDGDNQSAQQFMLRIAGISEKAALEKETSATIDPTAPRFGYILPWMLPDTVKLVERDASDAGLMVMPGPGPIHESWRVNVGLAHVPHAETLPLYTAWVDSLMAVLAFKHRLNAQPEKPFERPAFPPAEHPDGCQLPIIENKES